MRPSGEEWDLAAEYRKSLPTDVAAGRRAA